MLSLHWETGEGVIVSALHALENLTFTLLMAITHLETFGGKLIDVQSC